MWTPLWNIINMKVSIFDYYNLKLLYNVDNQWKWKKKKQDKKQKYHSHSPKTLP